MHKSKRKRRIRTILLIGSCKCFLFLLAQTGSAVALNSLTKNKKTLTLALGKRDSNTHCLTMDVFAIFQLVGFDRRQACLHPAALKSCEKHLSVRCEQFNIRDFCRYKENTAENTCRIFKVFDAITAKISMLNQYGFGSRLPTHNSHEAWSIYYIFAKSIAVGRVLQIYNICSKPTAKKFGFVTCA